MTDWLLRQGQAHPGRMIVVGFIPAMAYLVYVTVAAVRSEPWMALIMVPLCLGGIAIIVALGKLAELNAHLERRAARTSDPRNDR